VGRVAASVFLTPPRLIPQRLDKRGQVPPVSTKLVAVASAVTLWSPRTAPAGLRLFRSSAARGSAAAAETWRTASRRPWQSASIVAEGGGRYQVPRGRAGVDGRPRQARGARSHRRKFSPSGGTAVRRLRGLAVVLTSATESHGAAAEAALGFASVACRRHSPQ